MGNNRRFLIRCKLTTPFLAARRKEKMRIFDINNVGDKKFFKIDTPQWRWAIREAFDSMGLIPAVDIDYLRLPAEVLAPAIRTYKRTWESRSEESFECFQSGTVITFPVFILGELEQRNFNGIQINARPPTKEEVKECFTIIGESIGLSPWGSKFGYGRFSVEEVE